VPAKHEVSVVRTEHWRGGARFYAECMCGWAGRRWGAEVEADADAGGHLLLVNLTEREGTD
jgi:hypothetical protein